MNIYDEAIEDCEFLLGEHENYRILKALKRAKKVDELLGLYQIKDTFSETYISGDFSILRGQEIIDTLRSIREEINIKEKELEEMK